TFVVVFRPCPRSVTGIALRSSTSPPKDPFTMSEALQSRAATLAHLRGKTLKRGESVPLPLTMASTFHAPGDSTGFHQYGRFSNPTWDAVEEMLAHLEDAPCIGFPSGMAAIAAVYFTQLKSGDR